MRKGALLSIIPLGLGTSLLLLSAVLTFARQQPPRAPYLLYADFNNLQGLELYRVRPDGTHRLRLTYDPAQERLPVWSPDGAWIAYVVNGLNRYTLYRQSINGHIPQRLAQGQGFLSGLEWSGEWLIYSVNYGTVQQNLRLRSSDPVPQPADRPPSPSRNDRRSPDGLWIAYTQYFSPYGHVRLYRADPDGSNPVLLHDRMASDTAFRWSPLVDLRWHVISPIIAGLVLVVCGATLWRLA